MSRGVASLSTITVYYINPQVVKECQAGFSTKHACLCLCMCSCACVCICVCVRGIFARTRARPVYTSLVDYRKTVWDKFAIFVCGYIRTNVRIYVRPSVLHEVYDNVLSTTTGHWTTQFCTSMHFYRYVRQQICFRNVEVLVLHFKSQIFKSIKFGSLYAITSQTVRNRTTIAIDSN